MNSYGEELMRAATHIGAGRFSVSSDIVNQIALKWSVAEVGIDPRKDGTWSSRGVYPL